MDCRHDRAEGCASVQTELVVCLVVDLEFYAFDSLLGVMPQ